MAKDKICINCNRELIEHNGLWLCSQCNSKEIQTDFFIDEQPPDDDYIFIECPGATLYEDGTNNIIGGVKFNDDNDPFKGYKIIGEPVFSPTHNKKRMITKEALGKIRRCQGCQDYTVRMRRKEGADFFIPSVKHPKRKKLKTIKHMSSAPIK